MQRARAGDAAAREQLYAAMYAQLLRVARAQLGGSRENSLNPSALLHEAYLRMSASAPETLRDRRAFCAYAARAMRSVLIDHVRERGADKRGGGVAALTLTTGVLGRQALTQDFSRLNDALQALQAIDERCHAVVELRYFGGLSEEEVAAELGLSMPTIKRDWRKARAFLLEQLR